MRLDTIGLRPANGIQTERSPIVAAAIASGRALGFTREMLMAAALGTGPVADAFNAATLPRINRVTEDTSRAVRQLSRTHHVDQATFDRLKSKHNEQWMVELTGVRGTNKPATLENVPSRLFRYRKSGVPKS